jgi:hypothetical protein
MNLSRNKTHVLVADSKNFGSVEDGRSVKGLRFAKDMIENHHSRS